MIVHSCVITTVLLTLVPTYVLAQDCPDRQSGSHGFVVERGEQQKSEIFHDEEGRVRTVMRYAGETLLEVVLYEGLFELDRLDRGRRTKFELQSDLKTLFPLRAHRDVSVTFTTESDGATGAIARCAGSERRRAIFRWRLQILCPQNRAPGIAQHRPPTVCLRRLLFSGAQTDLGQRVG